MALPNVAIIGRPNVGKSSLFNAIVRRRISIEDPRAGITRDRVSAIAEFDGRRAEVIDTGGIGIVDADNLSKDIEQQIDVAIEEADVIVFVVDVRDGVTTLDKEVADRVRRLGKPTILVANKADTGKYMAMTGEFAALGTGEALAASAKEKRGIDTLRTRIAKALAAFPEEQEPEGEEGLKLAIAGKRNAGKSTLVNHLAKAVRVIVSEVPGTTRDSVDVPFEYEGRRFVAIDTAGLRKKRSMKEPVEFYSTHRAQRSIRRADVVVFLIDATTPISEVDKKLASYIVEEKKPVIVTVNKYDLAKDIDPEKYRKYLDEQLSGITFAPMAFVSALTGFNVAAILETAEDLRAQARYRATTGELNRLVESIVARRKPRAVRGRLPKIYYATQSHVEPPTIVFFVSNPAAFDANYVRYMENALRKELPFAEVPLKIVFRESKGPGRSGAAAPRRPEARGRRPE
jgi:GTP-binding protein